MFRKRLFIVHFMQKFMNHENYLNLLNFVTNKLVDDVEETYVGAVRGFAKD